MELSDSIEVVTIFDEKTFIKSVIHLPRWESETGIKEKPFYTYVTGQFLPLKRVLIVTYGLKFEHDITYLPQELDKKFPHLQQLYTYDLAQAARACIKKAEEYPAEVKRYLDPPQESTDTQTNGGPYRTLPRGSKLL